MEISFPIKIGLTCNYQTVSNIMKYYGTEIPEEFVYLVMKCNFENDITIHIPYFSNNAVSKLGYRINVIPFYGQKDFEKKVMELLKKKHPIILNVKSDLLPYYPKGNENFQNEAHALILHGINERMALVSDSYVPYYPPDCIREWIDMDVLFQAILASKDKDKMMIFEKEEDIAIDLHQIAKDNLKTLLFESIENNKKMLREEEINSQVFEDVKDKSAVFNRMSREEIEDIVKHYRLQWLAFDGPAQIRKFLENIFTYLQGDNEQYVIYAKAFQEYYRKWISISNAYFRFSVRYDMEYFDKVSNRYVTLLNEEINFMKEMVTKI